MNGKEFIKALDNIIKEKGISEDIVYEAMEQGLTAAYKKNYGGSSNVRVDIDRKTGEFKVVRYYVVVDEYLEGDEVVDEEGNVTYTDPEINEDAQLLLEEAKERWSDAKVGDTFEEEVTPADFGRVAASTCKQVVTQKIREAEKNSIVEEYADKQDELYVQKVEIGNKGPLIILSRKFYGFVKRLFEQEIPEFQDGTLILHAVAREAGVRSKVAVSSTNERVDAIGTCIGERGSRIASILKELNGEKVDLVLYSEDPAEFIQNALSPAKNVIVSIIDQEKSNEALAIVPDDELPMAYGKKGINIRLAARLTKFKINVKTMTQVQEEGNQ